MFTSQQLYVFIFFQTMLLFPVAFFLCRSLTPRSWVRHPYLCYITVLLSSPIYAFLFNDPKSAANSYIFYGSIVFVLLVFFKDKLLYRISALFFMLMGAAFTEVFMYTAMNLILDRIFNIAVDIHNIVSDQNLFHFFMYMFPILIVESTVIYLETWLWKRVNNYLNLKIMLSICISPTLLSTNVVFLTPYNGKPYILLMIFLVVLACNLLFFNGLMEFLQNNKQAKKDKVQKLILEQTLINFQKTEEQNLMIRKRNHDMTNHLQVISYLVNEQNDPIQAKEYISNILADKSYNNQEAYK